MKGVEHDSLRLPWIEVGIGAGLVAVGSYTFLVITSGGIRMTFVIASVFSVSLGLASFGLYQFLTIERRTLVAQVAAVATGVGAVLFLAMASIQLAIKSDLGGVDPVTLGTTFDLAERVHLGLDVAWDVYFAIGVALFGVSAYTHPRLGRVIGAVGVLVAVALVALNVATFPIPPASAGSFDLGPAAGLWYLVVTIQIARSLDWAKQRLIQ